MDEFAEWYLGRFGRVELSYWMDIGLPFVREYMLMVMVLSGGLKLLCGITPVSLMAEGSSGLVVMSSVITLGCLLTACERLLKPLVNYSP